MRKGARPHPGAQVDDDCAMQDDPLVPSGRARRDRAWERRFALVAIVVAAASLVVANRSDLPVAWRAARHARPGFLIAGLVLVAIAMFNQAGFHAAAQRVAGQPVRGSELVVAVSAAGFANLVVKSGAMAGLAPMLAVARRRNRSRAATVAGYLLVNVIGHLAFACILGVGLVVLVVDGRFGVTDALAAGAFVVLSATQLALLRAAFRSREAVRRLYRLPRRVAARLPVLRRLVPGNDTPSETEHPDELFEAVQLIRTNRRAMLPVLGHSLGVEFVGVAELYCVLRALGVHPHASVPIVAYAISVLFTIIGFLPGGIGFVEASLGAVLVSFGVARGPAVAAVVLYRILELWIPMIIGLVAARHLTREDA